MAGFAHSPHRFGLSLRCDDNRITDRPEQLIFQLFATLESPLFLLNSSYAAISFQDRQADSVSDCSEGSLRQIEKSIAAPNGHDLATHDNWCHLPADLGRVVETWPKLSAEARLMIMALVSAAESNLASNPK